MRQFILAMICLATFSAGLTRADTPPAADAQTVSPAEVDQLVTQLSADDYEVRQEALKKLQSTIGNNMKHMVLVQESLIRLQQNLADELQMLTKAHDFETVARTASLMEFNLALSKWAIDAMQLPETQRTEALKWGLSPEGMQLVGRAYSPRSDIRAAGIAEMGKIPGLAVSILLTKMMNDPDREVSIAAMDALWDRQPTSQELAQLWDKGVANIMAAYGGQRPDMRNRIINFHGRTINVMANNGYNNVNFEDSAMAVDVLVHLQAPDTADRLKAFLLDLARQPMDNNNGNYYRFQMLLPNYGGAGQSLQRLIDTFHPREVVAVYMHYINGPGFNDGNNGEQDINGKKYRYGTRIEMLYRVCKFSGQDPDTYNLKHIPQFGDRWLIEGTQKEEDAAINKIKAWWETHKAEYGEKPADVKPVSDKPAETKPATPKS